MPSLFLTQEKEFFELRGYLTERVLITVWSDQDD
jgi:ABC-type transporter Mla MlaB component